MTTEADAGLAITDAPMSGIRVVEIGFWVAGPAAAGLLADWGASVIKIEPASGDPMRAAFAMFGESTGVNPPFEMNNRGKRSICLDLRSATGQKIARDLVGAADVFITNVRQQALRKMGLDFETLNPLFPRLVYGEVSGYGRTGPDADRAAFDVGAYWSRAGVAHVLSPPGAPPPQQRGGMGDHWAGVTLAAGVAAALLRRERTGTGQLVSTSLLRVGAYTLAWDLSMAMRMGITPTVPSRESAANPLHNAYRTADDRWLWLLGAEGDRHWPNMTTVLGLTDLVSDPRFTTMIGRAENSTELVRIIDEVIGQRTLSEWREILDVGGVWWAPVQAPDELLTDAQADAAGLFVDVPTSDAPVRMLAGPVDFDGAAAWPQLPSPQLGEHTAQVLLELGLSHDDISRFASEGVIP
jgi:crotonobetainyl-CoA:carnitine CoA-transferase CaiB-like acyl-CoA transferase